MLIILLIIALIGLAYILLEHSKQNSTPENSNDSNLASTSDSQHGDLIPKLDKSSICETHICSELSKQLTNNIEIQAQPCQNLYQYVCGGNQFNVNDNAVETNFYLKQKYHQEIINSIIFDGKNFIATSLSRSSQNLIPESVNEMYRFYDSCNNFEVIQQKGHQPIVKWIRQDLGGWPNLLGLNELEQENLNFSPTYPSNYLQDLKYNYLTKIFQNQASAFFKLSKTGKANPIFSLDPISDTAGLSNNKEDYVDENSPNSRNLKKFIRFVLNSLIDRSTPKIENQFDPKISLIIEDIYSVERFLAETKMRAVAKYAAQVKAKSASRYTINSVKTLEEWDSFFQSSFKGAL